jgi:hypothetical protein
MGEVSLEETLRSIADEFVETRCAARKTLQSLGDPFLQVLDCADTDIPRPAFLPRFVADIKSIFEVSRVADFVRTRPGRAKEMVIT